MIDLFIYIIYIIDYSNIHFYFGRLNNLTYIINSELVFSFELLDTFDTID